VDQLVNRHHLRATKIDRLVDGGLHDRPRPMHTVIDPRKAPRLRAIPPHLDLVPTGDLRLRNLPTDCRRRLLPSTVPAAMRPIHVVIPRHPYTQAEILREMAAHALAKQFLPAVPVLR